MPSKSFGFEMHWYDLLDFHEKQLKYLKELFRNYELDPTFPFPFVKCNEDNIAIQELGTITVRLQNFIIKIGTIITYLLLHAGSSDLIRQISESQRVTHKGSVDNFVQKWLQNVILSLHLLTEFKKIISFVKPPHETNSPWVAFTRCIDPCSSLRILESVKAEDDFTCTQIRGSLNPKAPGAAKISTLPSFPGPEFDVA